MKPVRSHYSKKRGNKESGLDVQVVADLTANVRFSLIIH